MEVPPFLMARSFDDLPQRPFAKKIHGTRMIWTLRSH